MAIGRIPEPGTGIPESIVDAKGDIVTATAADTPARLAVGTNNQTLVAASGEATGLKYANGSVSTLTAKGDLLTATAANTIARLPVGTNTYTLVADSAEATGLKWVAASSGAMTKITRTTFSNVANQDFDNVFDTTYGAYIIIIEDFLTATANNEFLFTLRNSGGNVANPTTNRYRLDYNDTAFTFSAPANNYALFSTSGRSTATGAGVINVFGVDGTTSRPARLFGQYVESWDGVLQTGFTYYPDSPIVAVTGFRLSSTTNISGTVTVLGVNK